MPKSHTLKSATQYLLEIFHSADVIGCYFLYILMHKLLNIDD